MNKLFYAFIISAALAISSSGALLINNGGGATNITATSAWVTATIVSTGAANPYLYVYWGTNDGSTNASSWGNTNSIGSVTQTSYSVQVTDLSAFSIYYHRAFATNSSTTNWAAYSAQFITLFSPTSAPAPSTRGVSVDTNGVLKNPTNFWTANSTGINAVVTNTGGYVSDGDFASHTNNESANILHSTAAEKAHAAAAITNETDPVWESEKSGYATGTPIYVEADPVWESEKAGYATGTPLYVYSETDPVWEAEKAGYATGTPLYVESYTGTIVGLTGQTGAVFSVTTNNGVLDLTVPSGGGGAGTITNMLSTDSSIVWTDSEGPQPIPDRFRHIRVCQWRNRTFRFPTPGRFHWLLPPPRVPSPPP